MIPNISKSGTSFRGAGAYYLHDKAADPDLPRHLKPTTDDRVSFVDTRNCVNIDPQMAIDEMWATAEVQTQLKRQAGLSTAGRKCENPVKTISMSWHPSEQPTPDQMLEAADSYLGKMGWGEHQAMLIGHKDTEHAHLHIILNRVHPETGRVLDDFNDFKRSQTWALDYEREQGRIFCEKRLEIDLGHGHEAKPANDNIPHEVIQLTKQSKQDFERSELDRKDRDAFERATLKQQQREEREAWFEEGAKLFKETRNAVWREVKAEFRDEWVQFYEDKRERDAEALKLAQSAMGQALHFAKAGDFEQAWKAFHDKDAIVDTVTAEFAARRQELVQAQKLAVQEGQTRACDALRGQREADYQQLLERQKEERSYLKEAHALGQSGMDVIKSRELTPPAPSLTSDIIIDTRMFPPPVEIRQRSDAGTHIDVPPLPSVPSEERSIANMRDQALTGAADLAAGGIGAVADYLADQLAEVFAPTAPEIREARAKAADFAKDQAEADRPPNPYMRHAGEADQKARADREQQEADRYWDLERERSRER